MQDSNFLGLLVLLILWLLGAIAVGFIYLTLAAASFAARAIQTPPRHIISAATLAPIFH